MCLSLLDSRCVCKKETHFSIPPANNVEGQQPLETAHTKPVLAVSLTDAAGTQMVLEEEP